MARTRKRAAETESGNQQSAPIRAKRRRKASIPLETQDPAEHDDRVEADRQEEAQALQAEEIVGEMEAALIPESEEEPDRRQNMADIARRRAAHFAHFQADDGEEVENAHTGGTEARKLGPWSSAMELIEARAAAVEARKGRLAAKAGDLASEDIEWTPPRDPGLGPRPYKSVDTLFRSCVRLIVENIDDIDTLVGIPELIKIQLSAELSRQRKMTARVAALMTEGSVEEVVLPECTQMKEEELLTALQPALTHRLERLQLDLCGRGFGDRVAASMAKGDMTKLRVLALGGAYRLTDDGLLHILRVAPNLDELHLPQCCRIQGPALEALPALTPNLRTLNLTDCRGLSSIALRGILCESAREKNLKDLESLSLDSIGELDDPLIIDICLSLPKLSRLSIALCIGIGDSGIKGIAAGCGPRLTELNLDEVTKVTDEGLLALSESCTSLQVIKLRRCHRLTDAGVGAVTSAGKIRVLGADQVSNISNVTIKALAATCSSAGLGFLVDSCANLQKITLFGCTQIGTDFINGHGNDALEIVGAPQQVTAPPERLKLTLDESPEE